MSRNRPRSSRKRRTVRYVDTSVLLNLLDVPGRNQERARILHEFETCQEDTYILPLTSIIETGNHIAHLANGADRQRAGEAFATLLKMIAREELPWALDKLSIDREDLEFYADNFPNYAVHGIGIGDLSIIREFQRYVERIRPSVTHVTVKIWSLDGHLSGFQVDL